MRHGNLKPSRDVRFSSEKWSLKGPLFFSLRDGDGPLGSGVPGDGLGSLGHGVPSQLARQQQLHSHLVLAARDG